MNDSDSDPTECISDLDTGQDGGDECDTDDLLDIDFIDNGSIQEIIDSNLYENTGSCSYFNFHPTEKRMSRVRKASKKPTEDALARRRKRLTRTRKSSRDCRDASQCSADLLSPVKLKKERESKSLGGTPVSLRRNQSHETKK